MISKEEQLSQFKEYVYGGFDIKEKAINLKYQHSIRTAEIAEEIAKLAGKDFVLAYTIGLLHDYARFYQYTKYKTYNDLKSEDHGDKAVDILFQEGEINKYCTDEKLYAVIFLSIKLHNKFEVDEKYIKEYLALHESSLSFEEVMWYVKMIRDADKLDIFKIFCNGSGLSNFTKSGLSNEVEQFILNKKSIKNEFVCTKLDRIISILGFLYDMNHVESKQYLNINELINKINNNYNKELSDKDNDVLLNIEKTISKDFLDSLKTA